jgi:acyl-CoA thioesterase-1
MSLPLMNLYVKGGHRNIAVVKTWLAAALALTVAGCAPRSDDREDLSRARSRDARGRGVRSTAAPRVSAVPAKPPAGARPRIAVLGDSLTAGLGVPKAAAYPALLQQRLDADGFDFEVVDAGVSGDTSAGGLARLDWALNGDVRVLIVALGGNDALRGLPAEELRRNLAQIIERAQARGITVILAGMEAPPNYGRDYIVSFHTVYPALAAQYGVALVPFLLQGVAGNEALNQPDGIHPTAAGARIVADNVWAVLKPIAEARRRPTT